MYRYQYGLFQDEAIYIAGPECFYTHGPDMLMAMRKRAESLGFQVTLPNDHPLDMLNEDYQKRADSIFEDLKTAINHSTVILSDLEAYRGAEPDSGTVYEIGMAYARGIRSYGYTRDKRSMAAKNQHAVLKDKMVYDEKGRVMPYSMLPFLPSVIGSTKIIEGDFDDCLRTLMVDIEEEYKARAMASLPADMPENADVSRNKEQPVVYLSGFERYDVNGDAIYHKMKELCRKNGLIAVSPLDDAPGFSGMETDNPYTLAANLFDNYQRHVRHCDIIIANLNDYRGYEPCNDVGFECGMGFQLGKKLYGYMDSTEPLIHRLPHLGEASGFRDHTGCNVENFNYPANLMFACSMKIFEGNFAEILLEVVKDLAEPGCG